MFFFWFEFRCDVFLIIVVILGLKGVSMKDKLREILILILWIWIVYWEKERGGGEGKINRFLFLNVSWKVGFLVFVIENIFNWIRGNKG